MSRLVRCIPSIGGVSARRRDSSREQPRSTDPDISRMPTENHRAGRFETRSIAGTMAGSPPDRGLSSRSGRFAYQESASSTSPAGPSLPVASHPFAFAQGGGRTGISGVGRDPRSLGPEGFDRLEVREQTGLLV